MPTELQVATYARPHPVRFLSLAWRAIRRVPDVWVARLSFDLFAYAFRFVVLFAVGLGFVLHLGIHVRSGLPLSGWPTALLASAGRPGVVVGLGGMVFVIWLFMFAVEAFVFAGIWSATRTSLLDGDLRRWRAVWDGAVASFPQALAVRVLVRASEVVLLVATVGSVVLIWRTASFVAAASGSAFVAPAATWALLLTIGTCAAIVLRLTAEFVAAAVYIDGVGLGEAILRAATTVLAHPVYVYRLFIMAAAVLIGPLLVAWAAATAQNLLMLTASGEALAWVLRFAAEFAIIAGLGAFSVMRHGTFFAYYAWEHDRIERSRVAKPKPTIRLADLLPPSYDHIVDVSEILRPWTADEILPVDDDAPLAATPHPVGAYDLGAILGTRDEEE